jgi:hypothetical protein
MITAELAKVTEELNTITAVIENLDADRFPRVAAALHTVYVGMAGEQDYLADCLRGKEDGPEYGAYPMFGDDELFGVDGEIPESVFEDGTPISRVDDWGRRVDLTGIEIPDLESDRVEVVVSGRKVKALLPGGDVWTFNGRTEDEIADALITISCMAERRITIEDLY